MEPDYAPRPGGVLYNQDYHSRYGEGPPPFTELHPGQTTPPQQSSWSPYGQGMVYYPISSQQLHMQQHMMYQQQMHSQQHLAYRVRNEEMQRRSHPPSGPASTASPARDASASRLPDDSPPWHPPEQARPAAPRRLAHGAVPSSLAPHPSHDPAPLLHLPGEGGDDSLRGDGGFAQHRLGHELLAADAIGPSGIAPMRHLPSLPAASLLPPAGPAPSAAVSAAAGVIFGCTNSTYDECFELSMVGLPRKYLPLVESIVEGHTKIFLFNFSDRLLHGVYLATSAGQENLSLTAWKSSAPSHAHARSEDLTGYEMDDDGSNGGSPFPAQCTFEIVEEFAPVPEAEFRHVLEYTERQRFKFKLSHWQCRDLLETMCRYDAKLRSKRTHDTEGLKNIKWCG